ncbi:tRNA threonylcarbamoyladenosine biosynthesis protein TsaE [Granulicella pectinivorans]|jgi:tRNA threonylcarbamoyladenosine biosynthesis protein TsaE|uniref:tRNA threonylcarbamoyladenosine biosynthesis protein TsaE n=1 Tax=Granulicella pectinivorans TaxID=474950 RepID=A0A1I6MHU8_9BACT|nr:tRNA (adenosine(37)-N6)-threonylcarbamoyltransferase complex ATPase subunit type 1 TsaE [Granulicella pectinivorans]SFS15187.1 tRNA threonylcarbamoyladenosine biosynthesis protein TsaE [Granulicella pectinivorans]
MKEWTREKRLKTRSVNGTLGLGEMVSEILRSAGKLIILRGDLGAGKTTLVKGIAAALGAATEEDVVSPTFTLVHTFPGRKVTLYHLDVYRLETERELATLGIEEMVEDPNALVIVEWGEKFPSLMEAADAEVILTQGELENERLLHIRWRA